MPQTLHRALRVPASPTSEPCRRGDFGDLCLDLLAAAPHQMELILSLRSPPRLLRNAAGSEALGCHCACVKGGWGKMGGGAEERRGRRREKRRKGICRASLASFQNCLADMLSYADTGRHGRFKA